MTLQPPAPDRKTLFECRTDTARRRRALRLRNIAAGGTMAIIVAIPLAWVAALEPTISMKLLAASTVTALIAVFAGLTIYADRRNRRAESFVLRLTDWGVEFNAPVRNSQLGGVRERGGAVPWNRMNEVHQAPWWFSKRFGLLEVDFFPLGYHRGYPVLTVPAEGPWRIDVPWLLKVDADKATQIAREQIALHPSIVPRTPVDRRARSLPRTQGPALVH